MNPANGLRIRPFKNAHTTRGTDKELVKLSIYLKKIATLTTFESLDHKHWESYLIKHSNRDNWRLFTWNQVLLSKKSFKINLFYTVWKIGNFSVTQILREITFCWFQKEALNLDFWDFYTWKKFPKIQNGSCFWGYHGNKRLEARTSSYYTASAVSSPFRRE